MVPFSSISLLQCRIGVVVYVGLVCYWGRVMGVKSGVNRGVGEWNEGYGVGLKGRFAGGVKGKGVRKRICA